MPCLGARGLGVRGRGARSFCAIAEWAADVPDDVVAALGVTGSAPHESTIGRVLRALDANALDAMIGAWLAARSRPGAGRPAIAVDGKSMGGAIGGNGRAGHLLAAIEHEARVVLGQVDADGKTNEISRFAPLLPSRPSHAVLLFRDGRTGRRAVLVGGPDVREVVRAIKSARASEPKLDSAGIVTLVETNTGVSARLIDTAIRYWSAYPKEIDAWIADVDELEIDAVTAWERQQDLLSR